MPASLASTLIVFAAEGPPALLEPRGNLCRPTVSLAPRGSAAKARWTMGPDPFVEQTGELCSFRLSSSGAADPLRAEEPQPAEPRVTFEHQTGAPANQQTRQAGSSAATTTRWHPAEARPHAPQEDDSLCRRQ